MRFLHTSDWQLGMPAHFLNDEALPRFRAARLEVIREIGRVAAERSCEFILVCGDVFDSNLLSLSTIRRTMEALRLLPVPVYLLPGNHDPLDPASIYRSDVFRQECPAHVHVLDRQGIVPVQDGVELVAAPWTSKQPLEDLVASACRNLTPPGDTLRIVVGHGAIDALMGVARGNPATIRLDAIERHLESGHIHYVALGDRHSCTSVGRSGRVWYSGSPEATDFGEDQPGHVLVIDLEPGRCQV